MSAEVMIVAALACEKRLQMNNTYYKLQFNIITISLGALDTDLTNI